MFLKILALLRVAIPLPSFADPAALAAWLKSISEPLAELIAAIAGQVKTTGRCAIELPGGETVEIVKGDVVGTYAMSMPHQSMLCAANPEGDGKWLEFIKTLLPIILQVLPFLLKDEPAPTPKPDPVV
jgi:hypothetical protein